MQVDELLPFLSEYQNELIQQIKWGKCKPNPVCNAEIPKEDMFKFCIQSHSKLIKMKPFLAEINAKFFGDLCGISSCKVGLGPRHSASLVWIDIWKLILQAQVKNVTIFICMAKEEERAFGEFLRTLETEFVLLVDGTVALKGNGNYTIVAIIIIDATWFGIEPGTVTVNVLKIFIG